MSGWDWIHAGMSAMTYSAANKAQKSLTEMQTAAEYEMAKKQFIELMRNFLFDVSRDAQLIEREVDNSPQQAYIVARAIDWRLRGSGLSTDVFTELQDKEYLFQTEVRIGDIVEKAKTHLGTDQITESDQAVKYLTELGSLQEAITAKGAQESLRGSESEWRELEKKKSGNKATSVLGVVGLVISMCIIAPLLLASMDTGGALFISLLLIIGTTAMIILGGRKVPGWKELKEMRENWQKLTVSREEWQEIVALFGNRSSQEYQHMFNERIAYLRPLLGSNIDRFLEEGSA